MSTPQTALDNVGERTDTSAGLWPYRASAVDCPLLLREGRGLLSLSLFLTVTMASVMCSGCSPEAFLIKQMHYALVPAEEGELLAGLFD